MMKLLIVSGSVRDGRATPRVVKLVEKIGRETQSDIEWEVVDLKELDLPMFKEPQLPMMNPDRQLEGSLKTWIDALDSADGFVFVTPEYNHGMPAGLKSAIDYINFQVMKKPFLVVSHGAEGGARSGEHLKNVLNANIGAVPIGGSVAFVGMIGFQNMISEEGEILADSLKGKEKALTGSIETLKWYAEALKAAREK
jgi:NAD(P)H-dependent FMN reductase